MQNPDEQLRAILEGLSDQVSLVLMEFEIYTYIMDCARDKRKEALYQAPAFFQVTQNALVSNIIISLHKLFDTNKNARRSLPWFLAKLKENKSSLTLKHAVAFDMLIDAQILDIEKKKPILAKIGTHRNKYRAHSDNIYFDNPNQLGEDAPISVDELRDIIDFATEIIETYCSFLLGVERMVKPQNSDDIKGLISFIQQHQKPVIRSL